MANSCRCVSESFNLSFLYSTETIGQTWMFRQQVERAIKTEIDLLMCISMTRNLV